MIVFNFFQESLYWTLLNVLYFWTLSVSLAIKKKQINAKGILTTSEFCYCFFFPFISFLSFGCFLHWFSPLVMNFKLLDWNCLIVSLQPHLVLGLISQIIKVCTMHYRFFFCGGLFHLIFPRILNYIAVIQGSLIPCCNHNYSVLSHINKFKRFLWDILPAQVPNWADPAFFQLRIWGKDQIDSRQLFYSFEK